LLCVKITRQGEFVLWDPKRWNGLKHKQKYKKYHYIDYNTFWEQNKDAVKQQSNSG
jgi:hypothetical protein